MGSPEYCYKSILKDFILCNNKFTKQYKNLEENILPSKTIEELEGMALKYYKKNKDYSIFLMGACVEGFIYEWDECNDMLNACAGAIGDIQDLFNIDEDKETISTILEWHDCKTDPPKKDGEYILWYIKLDKNRWKQAYYNNISNEWFDSDKFIIYGNPKWGWSDCIPYKWAEIDLK